jgi:hypothetical protein
MGHCVTILCMDLCDTPPTAPRALLKASSLILDLFFFFFNVS